MTRVAIPVTANYFEWLGGLNYLRTLVAAVVEHGSGAIEPVVVAPRSRPAGSLDGFSAAVEVHETRLFDSRTAPWALRTAVTRATGTDAALDRLVRQLDARLLSHHAPLGGRARTPTLSWIPDVQHRRLPELFSSRELAARDRLLAQIDRHAAGVVVSSEAGRDDLANAIPQARSRIHVLRFVPDLEQVPDGSETAAALAAHGLEGPYLYLPNQLWVHKNHKVVVEALGLLRARGTPVTVVASGDTADPRSPGLAKELTERATELSVQADFRLLGRVSYPTVKALMVGSVAVVNPSLFEGWSTTVEEARALGKRGVLSDIDVHREQDLPGALYAAPHDPEAFARALAVAWEGEEDAEEERRRAAAQADHADRRRAFGLAYEGICTSLSR